MCIKNLIFIYIIFVLSLKFNINIYYLIKTGDVLHLIQTAQFVRSSCANVVLAALGDACTGTAGTVGDCVGANVICDATPVCACKTNYANVGGTCTVGMLNLS